MQAGQRAGAAQEACRAQTCWQVARVGRPAGPRQPAHHSLGLQERHAACAAWKAVACCNRAGKFLRSREQCAGTRANALATHWHGMQHNPVVATMPAQSILIYATPCSLATHDTEGRAGKPTVLMAWLRYHVAPTWHPCAVLYVAVTACTWMLQATSTSIHDADNMKHMKHMKHMQPQLAHLVCPCCVTDPSYPSLPVLVLSAACACDGARGLLPPP